MIKNLLFILLTLLLFFSQLNFAQDDTEIKVKVGGTIQAQASYSQTNSDTNQVGFGLRRVRGRLYSQFRNNLKGFIQFEMTSFKLLDAYLQYDVSQQAKFRIGRFKGAGMRGAGLTSHSDIDIIERVASGINWGRKTIGSDYRDYGASFFGDYNGLGYNLTVHNGKGDENIISSHASNSKLKNEKVAVSGMIYYSPVTMKGLEFGGYYGKGNSTFNDYNSYNLYLYYEPGLYRIKFEYVNVKDKNNAVDITSAGYYIFGAYKLIPKLELLGRFERYDNNTNFPNDAESIITLGAAYSFFPDKWSAERITAAYVIRTEEGLPVQNNVFYIMLQLVF